MTRTVYCDCCDLPEQYCGRDAERRQRAAEQAERARLLALPGVRAAEFPGRCANCNGWFREGSPIIACEWSSPFDREHLLSSPKPGWRCLDCCPVLLRGQWDRP